jgi:hypothetical protein
MVSMPDFVTTLLSSGLVAGAVGGLVQLWLRERIKHEYDEKIEHFKAQLQVVNAGAVERLKGELQIAALKRHIRFPRLHEKVADFVAEVYGKLFDIQEALANYVSLIEIEEIMGSKDERG